MSPLDPMTRRRAVAVLAAALAAIAAGNGSASAQPSDAAAAPAKDQPTKVPKAAVDGMNTFGQRLLAHALTRSDDTVVLSPFGLATAMLMVGAGAEGPTELAFRNALRARGIGLIEASRRAGVLARQLRTDDGAVILQSANGIWVSAGTKLLPTYAKTQQTDFNARIETCDFADPATLAAINAWFAEGTRNMIPQMLTELPPQTEIVLANALYFKGRWQTPFKSEETTPGPFRISDAQTIMLPRMQRRDRAFSYRETDQYQAVQLPFKNGAFNLLLVLPREGVNARPWVEGLDGARWAELLNNKGYHERAGDLTLPRLKLSTGGDMRPSLEAIGLAPAFGPRADFAAMSRSPIKLDQVMHRTALAWDEEGAEAAAATAVLAVRSAAPLEEPPFTMTIDRPFLFALRHAPTGTIVLLGLVTDPGVRQS